MFLLRPFFNKVSYLTFYLVDLNLVNLLHNKMSRETSRCLSWLRI